MKVDHAGLDELIRNFQPEYTDDRFRAFDTTATELETLLLLHTLISRMKAKKVLETGTYRGIGTAFLAHAVAAVGEGAHLWTIDRDPANEARDRLRNFGLEAQTTFLTGHSPGTIPDLPQPPDHLWDFIFIDAGHEYFEAIGELRQYASPSTLRLGGTVALHDTTVGSQGPSGPPVRQAILDFRSETLPAYQMIEFPEARGLILLQRPLPETL